MKALITLIAITIVYGTSSSGQLPDAYKKVDQMLWVVADLDKTIKTYKELGFVQITTPEMAKIKTGSSTQTLTIKLSRANLGGALINWIQPLEGNSLFHKFLEQHGEGAFSLVHKIPDEDTLNREITRLNNLGIPVLDKIEIITREDSVPFVLMDTESEGKYILAFTYGDGPEFQDVDFVTNNRHSMKLSQYAFAIKEAEPVSSFWHRVGLPEFQINHPELGDTKYYGEIVNHELVQGWQRHGVIAYEWCIPVRSPIVYEDHIKKHGEGIHHLAFNVDDMDAVLKDFTNMGYVVSMGGTWGTKDQPGSGRYEYIDLEESGGLTIELLWNYKEE